MVTHAREAASDGERQSGGRRRLARARGTGRGSDGGPSDRALVAGCLNGDQRAWESLVRRHASLVYAVLRRCGFDGDEAADLFHEVWLAAWDRLGTVPESGSVAGWLAALAARRALRRRQQRACSTESAAELGT